MIIHLDKRFTRENKTDLSFFKVFNKRFNEQHNGYALELHSFFKKERQILGLRLSVLIFFRFEAENVLKTFFFI